MTTTHQNPDQLSRLAETLWHERRLLEFLLFKLVSANLVLATDDRRFVDPAIAEVDKVASKVRHAEKDHRDGVMDLTNEIETLTRENRHLATLGLDEITGTLRLASGTPDTGIDTQSYTDDGRLSPTSQRPTQVDRVL